MVILTHALTTRTDTLEPVLQDTTLKPDEWYRRGQTGTQYKEICNVCFQKVTIL